MALVIENPETIQRIEERVAATGLSADEVIWDALETRPIEREPGPLTGARKAVALEALQALKDAYHSHRHPHDNRTADEIIGYDEFGLPT